MNDTLEQLAQTLEDRRQKDPSESYVASLHHKGLNKILEKVGEESTEFLLAAKEFQQGENAGSASTRLDLVKEGADVWFHMLVALSHLNISHEDILKELERRFSQSGLEEKASRTHKS
ncbi:Phosphoribosyl-ATP pyrophosphatase [Halomonadaceae bacterium LMG 33818]|uniref:phosphoribosyl-ATP diphosphatase n=1 Tax=Cernens ardua TaxID=3402176 RepID=UPI003EDB80F0